MATGLVSVQLGSSMQLGNEPHTQEIHFKACMFHVFLCYHSMCRAGMQERETGRMNRETGCPDVMDHVHVCACLDVSGN